MPAQRPAKLFRPIAYGGVLDESLTSTRNPGLTVAQNVVYRPFGSIGKRCGSSGYGGAFASMSPAPVLSGVRWYRGSPSPLKQMLVQCNDLMWVGNDSTGMWQSVGAMGLGSTPAFYASTYDPVESTIPNTPASDILIIAFGSGPPLKYDGTYMTQLSPAIMNQFTGCCNWHDHIWFWGDPNNPDTVFATDINNPEGFTFTLSQTPPGYVIGRGDGDALVQVCVALGQIMVIFKTRSISIASGYSFYQGEYQFSIQPWVSNKGTPSPHSVAVMNNTLYWWDGGNFNRMGPSDSVPTPIGLPIIRTAAIAAQNSQSAIRAIAGNFVVATVDGYRTYTNVYLCAIDSGSGYADTILMYDDDASQQAGKPAWSVFKGLNIGAFIPWGGPGDPSYLYLGDALNGTVRLFGGHATTDYAPTNPLMVVNVNTGQIDCSTPDLRKELRRIWMQVEANSTSFSLQVTSDAGTSATSSQSTNAPQAGAVLGSTILGLNSILGPEGGKDYQSIAARVNPSMNGKNFTFAINEASATSSYELIGLTLDFIEEPYNQ